jgi:hypothetical protein
VYFVQGILKLAGLALTFYQKDDLKLEPAQVGAPGTVVVVVVVLLLLVAVVLVVVVVVLLLLLLVVVAVVVSSPPPSHAANSVPEAE